MAHRSLIKWFLGGLWILSFSAVTGVPESEPKISFLGTNSTESQVIGSPPAESQLTGSTEPIVAVAGEDAILSVSLEPPINAEEMTVVVSRPDLESKYVFFYRDGRDIVRYQDPSYRDRTSLFEEELINGNFSLKLSGVKLEDEGIYIFSIKFNNTVKNTKIHLIVGKPKISNLGTNSTDKPKISILGTNSTGDKFPPQSADGSSLPGWAIGLIGVVVGGGVLALVCWCRRRKASRTVAGRPREGEDSTSEHIELNSLEC